MSAQSQVVSTSISSAAEQIPPTHDAKKTKSPRCHFRTSDKRRCTLLLHPSHPALCPYHARKERLLLDSERVGNELKSISGEFRTTTDINHVLGKLWGMLAQDRIPRKRAATLAYIAALLLPTVSRVYLETVDTTGFEEWKRTLRRAFPPRPALASPAPDKK